MSWLSKFMNLFLSDNEEDFDEKKEIVEKKEQPTEPNHINNNHVEAKVSYQYPKGNFRFPVIPDPVTSDRTEFKRVRQPNVQRTERVRRNESLPQIDRTSRKSQGSGAKFNYQEKRPFHPTEVPSPIYGFKSSASLPQIEALRVKNTESDIPLLSLQSSHYEELEKLEKYQLRMDDILIVEPLLLEDSFEEDPILEKNIASLKYEKEKEEVKIIEPVFIEIEEEYNEERNPKIDREQAIVVEPLSVETEPIILDDGTYNVNEIREATIVEPFIVESKESVDQSRAVIQVEEEREPVFDESPHHFVHIEEKPQYEQRDVNFINENEGIKEVQQPEQYIKPHHEQSDVVPVAETIEEDKQQLNPQSEKSDVPFNVIMLTTDKKKFNDNQQGNYQFPSLTFLNIPPQREVDDEVWLSEQRELLNDTFKNFNVGAHVVHVTQGPTVTRFEVHPEPGVKVNKITNLTDDIKLSLAARDIRMEAPIPGKNTIGIEVPNKESKMVFLREILRSPEFRSNPSAMTAVLGLDISGQPVVTDLSKMPHGLIAGATGSGKSVCINTILVSLLYKASPHEVKLLLIDPKMVELAPYNEIPHLVSPVITDVKAATGALKWAVEEMERRYELFAHSGARDITRYNQLVKEHDMGEHLPYLVIIIDELADLMMVAPGDVEEAICRIAQKARACGIHLIVATQRPSVDVITGLIKANIPTRIAFSVSSQVDSRTIIDVSGAEKLLGRGDMLFLENGSSKAVRLQGTFVSDEEIEKVVDFVKKQAKPHYLFQQEELMKRSAVQSDEDELFYEACEFIVSNGSASASSLQRRFRIGYNRAARLIDLMEGQGIISGNRGSKPRDVLITEEDLDAIHESSSF